MFCDCHGFTVPVKWFQIIWLVKALDVDFFFKPGSFFWHEEMCLVHFFGKIFPKKMRRSWKKTFLVCGFSHFPPATQDEKTSDVPNGESPECDADGPDGTQLTSLKNPTPEALPIVFSRKWIRFRCFLLFVATFFLQKEMANILVSAQRFFGGNSDVLQWKLLWYLETYKWQMSTDFWISRKELLTFFFGSKCSCVFFFASQLFTVWVNRVRISQAAKVEVGRVTPQPFPEIPIESWGDCALTRWASTFWIPKKEQWNQQQWKCSTPLKLTYPVVGRWFISFGRLAPFQGNNPFIFGVG